MTDKPLHERAAVRSEDHDRDLHRVHGRVREIVEVSPELVRLVLQIPGLADDPAWERPNVAIRLTVPGADVEVSRVYTVRACDTAAGTIEVDVVRHGVSSPMMRLLDGVRLGDGIPLVGPRPHFVFPEARGRELALFLDATAIPALYALLRQAPEGLHGRGWVATSDETAFAELPTVPGLALERVEPGSGFETQLRGFASADVVVWGAGERDEMRAVRSHFRGTLGCAKDDVAVFGYWKRGTSNTDIDLARLTAYEALLADGGTVTEIDDLALPI
ncbi:siderophore-interacting protein [Microbacterium sp. No. 7]|uniref:siderophore-interacting protein n=1 Tax=Microbacterium sp. No. 7 TaxID=1714373 RepID=UPI0006D02DC8|nr:siderophore-interacting protein [Microbacterium sp. No. 7]ALJ19170.1 siderophore synthetase [Microbacterium sp. No. 7]